MASVSRWQQSNPLAVELITKVRLPSSIKLTEFKRSNSFAQQADVIRLSPFENSDGWYVDIDCIPSKNPLHTPSRTTLFLTDSRTVGNQLFFWKVNEAFMNIWINEIKAGLQSDNPVASDSTGPGALTRAIYAYSFIAGADETKHKVELSKSGKMRHWPAHLVPASEIGKRLLKGSLATHFADASWVTKKNEKSRFFMKLTQQLAWLVRNSDWGWPAEVLRLLLKKKLRLRQLLDKETRHVTKVAPIAYLESTSCNKTISQSSSVQETIEFVRDLEISFIKTTCAISSTKLLASGWLPFIDKEGITIFGRPTLKSLVR